MERSSLCASVGIAPNKFLAKLASESGKPNGRVIITADEVEKFLDPLPVGRLWGVGPKSAQRLHEAGIIYVRDLKKQSLTRLAGHVGQSAAEHLHALAHGIDERPVEPPGTAKSISRETTFDEDVVDPIALRQTLARLVADVGTRLRVAKLWAGTVSLKVRYPDFTTVTRQRALETPTRNDDRLYDTAMSLWSALGTKRPVRLIGVGVTDLTSVNQGSLFYTDSKADVVADTMDAINGKLGSRMLRRGRELPRRSTKPKAPGH